eukprot:5230000-Pyramimonas_sp.AAC.1
MWSCSNCLEQSLEQWSCSQQSQFSQTGFGPSGDHKRSFGSQTRWPAEPPRGPHCQVQGDPAQR